LIIYKCEQTTETIKKGLAYKLQKNPGFYADIEALIIKPKSFSVRPADTEESRKEAFALMSTYTDGETYFSKNIMGRLYTVQFQDYSDVLVPLRPIGIELFE
jgi:hypothetical protein